MGFATGKCDAPRSEAAWAVDGRGRAELPGTISRANTDHALDSGGSAQVQAQAQVGGVDEADGEKPTKLLWASRCAAASLIQPRAAGGSEAQAVDSDFAFGGSIVETRAADKQDFTREGEQAGTQRKAMHVECAWCAKHLEAFLLDCGAHHHRIEDCRNRYACPKSLLC